MSSIAQPVPSRDNQLLGSFAGQGDPFLGSALFVGVVVAILFFIPGALTIAVVVLNPVDVFLAAVQGKLSTGLGFVLFAFVAVTAAAYFAQRRWLKPRPLLIEIVTPVISGFVIASVGIGSYFWVFTEFWQLLVVGLVNAFLLAAPAALVELTLRHTTQPLIGFTCTGLGDLPAELS